MNIYEKLTPEAREEIKEQLIDTLKWYREYASDLHNNAFNTDYFIVGNWQAEEWLKKHYGVFAAIEDIKNYEQDNFGEVHTDLSSAENVVNMLVYIAGEELISQIDALTEIWDDEITDESAEAIIGELKEI